MAMTPRLWSINGLSVETGLDRRTIAARLRGVPPDGRLHGHAAWYLTGALRAISASGAAPAAAAAPLPAASRSEPYPPGFEVLGGISDRHERGIVLGLLAALYPLASVVRDVALHHGLDEGTAARVAGDAFHEMVAIVEDEMRAAEVEPFREERPCWLEPDALWWRPPGEWEFPADRAEGDADGRA